MELISLILNFVLGSGIIGLLIFYRSKKRKASAEATGAELSNSDKLIAQYEGYINVLTAEQTDLKAEVRDARQEARDARSSEAKERDRVTGVYKELSDARVREQKALGALALAQYDKCIIDKCLKRTPKRDEITNEPKIIENEN